MSDEKAGQSSAASSQGAVAIVCGSGGFPTSVATEATARGQNILLVGLKGIAGPEIEAFPHEWVHLGEMGGLFKLLETRNIKRIAFVGALKRPDLSDLRLDWGAVKRLPDIARAFKGGDDHILKGILRLFEAEGLEVMGVDALAPALLVDSGLLVGTAPDAQALGDIHFGFSVLNAMAPFDTGQAAVIANNRVIAIEAAEGTDAMLERVAALRASGRWKVKGRAGVLVKIPKKGQDLRVDLPAIGPMTLQGCVKAGLVGVGVAAGRVLVLDREQTLGFARQNSIFIQGIAQESSES